MKLQKFMQLTKVDVAKKRIYGTFTAEVIDKSGEIADYETTKAAVQTWSADIHKASGGKSLGNIRKMHGKEIAGKAVEIIYDDANRAIHGVVEADDKTIKEASSGVLNGFSIGGTYANKWDDPVHKNVKRFTPVIAEISVVDNPCVPSAVFEFIKDASFALVDSEGKETMQKFAPKKLEAEQLDLDVQQKWVAKDGSQHDTKEQAFQKNADLLVAATAAPVLEVLENLGKEKPAEKVEKAMHHVARLASHINDLSDLAKSHEYAKGEGHPITEKLKKHVRGLSDTLGAMATDEAGDMADMHEACKAAGLTEDQTAAINKAFEIGKGLEKAQEIAHPDTLALEKTQAQLSALEKVFADLPAQIEKKFEAMTARIKHLEAQPAADKVVLTTVFKGGEEPETKPERAGFRLPGGQSPADIKQSF